MHFRTITFATLETLIFLGLPCCRKTPNFRDNLFLLLGTGICFAKWPLCLSTHFCAVLTPTSTICNLLTSGLNAADIDYDILVFARRGGKRVQADYC